jgi:predicted nucleic acid-binding protein
MQSAVISDTSCLILLDKIGKLEILTQLYGEVIITKEIALKFGQSLPWWCIIRHPLNEIAKEVIEASLDPGESSAIALALELDDCLLIIDDLKGRKIANHLGLTITGTLGVLAEAKTRGIIPSLKAVLHEIKKSNFRITQQLEQQLLDSVGES